MVKYVSYKYNSHDWWTLGWLWLIAFLLYFVLGWDELSVLFFLILTGVSCELWSIRKNLERIVKW